MDIRQIIERLIAHERDVPLYSRFARAVEISLIIFETETANVESKAVSSCTQVPLGEQHVACSDAMRPSFFVNLEVDTFDPLPTDHYPPGDVQTNSRDPVNDAFEQMCSMNWDVEAGDKESMGLRLALGDFYISNVVPHEGYGDVLRICTVRPNTNIDGYGSGDGLSATFLNEPSKRKQTRLTELCLPCLWSRILTVQEQTSMHG